MNIVPSFSRLRDRIKKGFESIVLKLWGKTPTKRMIWNEEFSSGQWEFLKNTSDDSIYGYLEKYLGDGTILDLGCGSGNTGSELSPWKYKSYTGVDVSDIAIQAAVARTRKEGRYGTNEYICDDISTYKPTRLFNIILFRESIYYFPKYRIRKLLERYSPYLKQNGVFIVTMYGGQKHKSITKLIEQDYCILEKMEVCNGATILVFK